MTEAGRGLAAAVSVIALSLGCGGSRAVDKPFVTVWVLEEQPCARPVAASRCYDLVISVSPHQGVDETTCRIYAMGDDGVGLERVASAAPDLDPSSAVHELAIVEHIALRPGRSAEAEVTLPVLEDPAFRRWQVDCDSGPPIRRPGRGDVER